MSAQRDIPVDMRSLARQAVDKLLLETTAPGGWVPRDMAEAVAITEIMPGDAYREAVRKAKHPDELSLEELVSRGKISKGKESILGGIRTGVYVKGEGRLIRHRDWAPPAGALILRFKSSTTKNDLG